MEILLIMYHIMICPDSGNLVQLPWQQPSLVFSGEAPQVDEGLVLLEHSRRGRDKDCSLLLGETTLSPKP